MSFWQVFAIAESVLAIAISGVSMYFSVKSMRLSRKALSIKLPQGDYTITKRRR